MTVLPSEWTRTGLKAIGFVGFVPLAALAPADASREPGVYIVLRETTVAPAFLDRSIAGRFKGVDSTVPTSTLAAAWVDGAQVLYIGRASRGSANNGIRRRLSQYRRHGAGGNVGHRGGEWIWQLEDSSTLLVCWRETPDDAVSRTESDLIDAFEAAHGRWPFANRKHERRRVPVT